MADEKDKAVPTDTAETLAAEAKMPGWRFLVIELRKLLIPVLTAALAGGGTAFLGWNLHGRGQAKDDATSAAQEQVKAMEELRAWVRSQHPTLAPVGTNATHVAMNHDAAEKLLKAYEADAEKRGQPAWSQSRRPDPQFVLNLVREANKGAPQEASTEGASTDK